MRSRAVRYHNRPDIDLWRHRCWGWGGVFPRIIPRPQTSQDSSSGLPEVRYPSLIMRKYGITVHTSNRGARPAATKHLRGLTGDASPPRQRAAPPPHTRAISAARAGAASGRTGAAPSTRATIDTQRSNGIGTTVPKKSRRNLALNVGTTWNFWKILFNPSR